MNKALFCNPGFVTEAAKNKHWSAEIEENCRVVYQKDSEGEGYYFHSLWNPAHDDHLEAGKHIIVPLRSVFLGTDSYEKNTEFANILGSSKDDKHNLSCWLDLFRNEGIPCDHCVTDGTFYDSITKQPLPSTSYCCGGPIIGGHVTMGQQAVSLPRGSSVKMIPICHLHNVRTYGHQGTGGGFYMRTKTSGTMVLLSNYLMLPHE